MDVALSNGIDLVKIQHHSLMVLNVSGTLLMLKRVMFRVSCPFFISDGIFNISFCSKALRLKKSSDRLKMHSSYWPLCVLLFSTTLIHFPVFFFEINVASYY